MSRSWRMTVYDLDLAGSASIKGGPLRFFYMREGSAAAQHQGLIERYDPDTGSFSCDATRLDGCGTVWIYEVAAFGSALIQDPAISIVLSRRFELDFGPPWLVRADRIEFRVRRSDAAPYAPRPRATPLTLRSPARRDGRRSRPHQRG